MSTTPSCQFPYPFNWVKVRAIGRQKDEFESLGAIFKILFQHCSMVVACIVYDNGHFFPGLATGLPELFEKFTKRFRIEFARFSSIDKLTITKPNGTEVSDLSAGWLMHQDGVLYLWCNPHSTS